MNLPFRRQNTVQSNPIIPEMNGPAQQNAGGSGVRWVRLVILVIVGLAILAGLIVGGKWTFDKATNHSAKPTVATSSSSTKKPQQPSSSNSSKPKSTPKAATNNSGASASSVSQSTQNPQPAAASSTASGNLSNTGPGDTVALFAGVTVFGTVVYHLVLRKRVS